MHDLFESRCSLFTSNFSRPSGSVRHLQGHQSAARRLPDPVEASRLDLDQEPNEPERGEIRPLCGSMVDDRVEDTLGRSSTRLPSAAREQRSTLSTDPELSLIHI